MAKHGSVKIIKSYFEKENRPLILSDFKKSFSFIPANEISMVLSYLVKNNYATRKMIENPLKRGRSQVWQYTYNFDRKKGNKLED